MRKFPTIYFHTNVPAPYRKHQFELLTKRFPDAIVYFTKKQAKYRPWKDSVDEWKVNVRHATQKSMVLDLLRQRWGSVHVCGAGIHAMYWNLLKISGLIGHSKVIEWDDGYTSFQLAKYKKSQGHSKSMIRRFLSWLSLKARVGAFTPSRYGAEMARLKGYNENQIVKAYFSHDVDYFSDYYNKAHKAARLRIRAKLGIDCAKKVILCISRYLDWKRLEDLAEALSLLESRNIVEAKSCEVILIGDGDWKAHLEILKKLKYVKTHLVRQMPPDEVLDYYCASDMFVFPSEGDIWGLVVNEALSMGLPVVCTDAIGASDVVKDNCNGYVVPVRRPDLILDRIIRLLDDERRAAFSSEARSIRKTWRTDLGLDALQKFIEEYCWVK